MTFIRGGPAGPDGAGGAYGNTTDDDRAALWRSLGGQQGILDGLKWQTVAGQMVMEFTPGSAAIEERDALGNPDTKRGYHVYQPPEDGNVSVAFDPADTSARNDAVVVAFCDVEDGSLGTGVSEAGPQIVVVRGSPGVTTPRTDTQINDWIGAGGWFRYLDVPIAASSTEIDSAGVVENISSGANGFLDAWMSNREVRGAGGESALNFDQIVERSGGVDIVANGTDILLTPGMWTITVNVTVEGGDQGANWASLLYRNGVEVLVQGWTMNGVNPRDTTNSMTRVVRVFEGDILTVNVRNNGGTNTLDVLPGREMTSFSAYRISD